jgi:hypothetical protein
MTTAEIMNTTVTLTNAKVAGKTMGLGVKCTSPVGQTAPQELKEVAHVARKNTMSLGKNADEMLMKNLKAYDEKEEWE